MLRGQLIPPPSSGVIGPCAIFSEAVAFFVAGPDLSYLPEEVLLCPGDGVTLTVPGQNTLGPVQEVIWQRNGAVFSTEPTVFIVDPGEYWVLVRDANNCAEDHNFTVIVGEELPNLMVETSGCGPVVEACLRPELGNDFAIAWSNGSTAPCTEFPEPGIYTVTVIDLVVGCSWLESFEISLSGTPPLLVFAEQHEYDQCNEAGVIFLSTAGGTPPYSYTHNKQAFTDLASLAPNRAGGGLMIRQFRTHPLDSIHPSPEC